MTSNVVLRRTTRSHRSEIQSLLDLSARLGRDPLLTQGSNGNTSVKLDDTLWVKATGKWLARAGQQPLLVPVPIAECLSRLQSGDCDPCAVERSCANGLRPSVETFMHAVLRHKVVLHVHSVNTIAWAVRQDATEHLEQRLHGLRWRWIPYTPSGPLLARKVRSACRGAPKPDVLILGNHGLVVCGEDCDRAESLLSEVERRLATPPRIVAQPNYEALQAVGQISGWRLPEDPVIHTLGTDGTSRRILQGGVLYPAQAVFLGTAVPDVPRQGRPSAIKRRIARIRESSPFLVVERSGVLESGDIGAEEALALRGYVEVVRRIDSSASIRYLSKQEVKDVWNAEGGAAANQTGRDARPESLGTGRAEELYRDSEAGAGLSGPGLR